MIDHNFNEKHVQVIAHNWLIQSYESANRTAEVYAKMEAYTIDNKRADGFLAIRTGANSIYTVSLECKRDLSSSSLRPVIHPKGLVYTTFTLSILTVLIIFSIWFRYNGISNLYVEPIIVLFILLIFSAIYIGIEQVLSGRKPWFLMTKDIYLQIGQYPADEKWLAFSVPLKDKEHGVLKRLIRECKKKGFGLLLVDVYTENVYREARPNPYKQSVNNNLVEYKERAEIVKHLTGDDISKWKPVKRTRYKKYHYRRIIGFSLFFVVTAIVFQLNTKPYQIPIAATIEPSQSQEQIQKLVQQETEQTMQQEIEPILAPTLVILDNVYDDFTAAQWRVKKLQKLGLEAKLGTIKDYETNLNIDNAYFVFLEDAESELKLLFGDYKKKLFDTGVEAIGAKIIEIKKRTNRKESK
jgi:hypothetical protein